MPHIKNIAKIPFFVLIGLFGGLLAANFFISSHPAETITNQAEISSEEIVSDVPYTVFQPSIPDTVYFAGERVPLEYFDVYESLDYEMIINTYRHSSTLLYVKRAARYFEIIEPILKQNGIPDDFKYLCVAESGLSNAISPSNAVGFWQFLKATGQEYKMEINNYVDERYNLEMSTKAACDYLNKAYKVFGKWSLAAVSYNMGMGGLSQRMKHQKVDNYWDLYLHEEPARYVYRIISLKIIMENPEFYGFNLDENDFYQPLTYKLVEVDTSIYRLQDFAASYGISYKMLKLYNPWIRDTLLMNRSGKKYILQIPTADSRIIHRKQQN
ncbi:MAG TPA: lytic transglycosylase domain-containing protein [Bacteroidales bacterium]|nr:lytic transglycosylase domain-containing protein [Bacteroidales bacterium]HQL70423.1 lytic transglycosylase domain-containing protein [Bacteroidales bacterium]